MALLRKHIRDDAGRRVPLYRTGWWPWRLDHEHPLTRAELEAAGLEPVSRFEFWVELAGRAAATLVPTALLLFAWPVVIHNASGDVNWRGIAFLVVLLVGAALGVLWCARWWTEGTVRAGKGSHGLMRAAGMCESCGYPLGRAGGQTESAVCPECGAEWGGF